MMSMKTPTADDVRKNSMIVVASAHAVYIETARKSAGKKGLKAIGEANRIHGLELGNAGIKEGGLRKGDPKSIFDFFDSAHPYFGFDLELLQASSSVLEMKVNYCPWLETFKAKNAGEDICEWVCRMDEGIGQAVDPDLKMTLTKCMMRGDGYCIYRYSK